MGKRGHWQAQIVAEDGSVLKVSLRKPSVTRHEVEDTREQRVTRAITGRKREKQNVRLALREYVGVPAR